MEISKENKVIDLVLTKLKYGEFISISTSILKNDFVFENDRELDNILKLAEEYDLLDRKGKRTWMYLTMKGLDIKNNGGWIKYLETEMLKTEKAESKELLEFENLNLQKESAEYAKKIRVKDDKIRDLTAENLVLQNKQLKKYILYSVISFILGAVLSNLKDILILLKILPQ